MDDMMRILKAFLCRGVVVHAGRVIIGLYDEERAEGEPFVYLERVSVSVNAVKFGRLVIEVQSKR